MRERLNWAKNKKIYNVDKKREKKENSKRLAEAGNKAAKKNLYSMQRPERTFFREKKKFYAPWRKSKREEKPILLLSRFFLETVVKSRLFTYQGKKILFNFT